MALSSGRARSNPIGHLILGFAPWLVRRRRTERAPQLSALRPVGCRRAWLQLLFGLDHGPSAPTLTSDREAFLGLPSPLGQGRPLCLLILARSPFQNSPRRWRRFCKAKACPLPTSCPPRT